MNKILYWVLLAIVILVVGFSLLNDASINTDDWGMGLTFIKLALGLVGVVVILAMIKQVSTGTKGGGGGL